MKGRSNFEGESAMKLPPYIHIILFIRYSVYDRYDISQTMLH